MSPEPLIVTTPTLAALCGVSARRVQQLADEGVIRSETRGTWNAIECVPAFHAHRIAQVEQAVTKRTGSAADRHVNAKARAVELRTAREEAVLIETEEAQAVVEELVGTAKAGFGGLAARVTRDLTLRATIEEEVDAIFDRLGAQYRHRAAELRRGVDLPQGAASGDEDAPTVAAKKEPGR